MKPAAAFPPRTFQSARIPMNLLKEPNTTHTLTNMPSRRLLVHSKCSMTVWPMNECQRLVVPLETLIQRFLLLKHLPFYPGIKRTTGHLGFLSFPSEEENINFQEPMHLLKHLPLSSARWSVIDCCSGFTVPHVSLSSSSGQRGAWALDSGLCTQQMWSAPLPTWIKNE